MSLPFSPDSVANAVLNKDVQLIQSFLDQLLMPQLYLPGFEPQSTIRISEENLNFVTKIWRLLAKFLKIPYQEILSAYGRHPIIQDVFEALQTDDIRRGLEELTPIPFIPILPAAPSLYENPQTVYDRLGNGAWLLEPKLDGWECQIHVFEGKARLFGRSGREFLHAPTVIKAAEQLFSDMTIIIESELVAVDPLTLDILPRTSALDRSVIHRAVAFDLLYYGQDYTRIPCRERRIQLEKILDGVNSPNIVLSEQVEVSSKADFQQIFSMYITRGCEGIIGKRPNAIYEAYLRTSYRIKVKPVETVDAVILAYSESPRSYLLGLLDDDTDDFIPFSWIVPQNRELDELVAQHIISRNRTEISGRSVVAQLRPQIVVEVKGNHLFPTTQFQCGYKQTGQGWSMTNLKLVAIRGDKSSLDATPVSEFLRLPVEQGHKSPNLNTKKRKTLKQPVLQHRGFMVAIEGIDGVGKETQAKLLYERLKDDGLSTVLLSFPQYPTFFGNLIREMLDGRLGDATQFPPMLSALPFAMDRWLSREEIKESVSRGFIVVCDRYTSSNAVYQASRSDDFEQANRLMDWVFQLEYEILQLPKPDLNILLSADRSVSKRLLNNRSERPHQLKLDDYEANDSLQNTASQLYQKLAESPDWRVVYLTGKNQQARDRYDIADEIIELVRSVYDT